MITFFICLISLSYSSKVFKNITLSYVIRRVVRTKVNSSIIGNESFLVTWSRDKPGFQSLENTYLLIFTNPLESLRNALNEFRHSFVSLLLLLFNGYKCLAFSIVGIGRIGSNLDDLITNAESFPVALKAFK